MDGECYFITFSINLDRRLSFAEGSQCVKCKRQGISADFRHVLNLSLFYFLNKYALMQFSYNNFYDISGVC